MSLRCICLKADSVVNNFSNARSAELANGRLAMMAIVGMLFQEREGDGEISSAIESFRVCFCYVFLIGNEHSSPYEGEGDGKFATSL